MIDTGRVANSTGNWVDGFAPSWARPSLRLARLGPPDRLVAVARSVLVVRRSRGGRGRRRLCRPVILFLIGAVAMRGAGCT